MVEQAKTIEAELMAAIKALKGLSPESWWV
jgi:hypothetical protein